jgi:hypothetical protein
MSTKTNQKSPLRDLNSDMGLTTREMQSQLVAKDAPHYYEVKIEGHPNGVPQMHCGQERDAIDMCERYPGSEYMKIYLPHPPQTVDVPYIRVAPDLELPMQQILPESQQEPLNLEL